MGKYPLIVLAVVSCAGTARAAVPVDAPIGVAFEDCNDAPLGTAAFLRALEVELGNSAVASDRALAPQIAVKLGCDGVAVIRISIGRSREEREIRLDDVATDERPRALALVTAELVQSTARASLDTRSTETARATTAPGPHEPPNPRPIENGKTKLRYWCGAGARLSIGVGNASYGGHAGVSRGPYRVQGDLLFSRARVSRGTINAGLAAVRLRRALTLVATPNLELELDVNGALGAAWALGSSDVPGTIAKRVLAPYADVTVGVALALSSVPGFDPDLELQVGRAAGTVSRADGVATLAIGGWFVGLEAGLRL